MAAINAAAVLLTALVGGCGGATGLDAHDPGADDIPDDGKSLPGIGRVFRAPGGDVYFGQWWFDPDARQFRRPAGCGFEFASGTTLANKRLFVPRFWLQETPVTNASYAVCVAAGRCTNPDHDIADPNALPWDDPTRADLPIYARYEQAEAYCQWAGGRLPSIAELLRAAQGDFEGPGVRALTEASIACFAPSTSPIAADPALCEQVLAMNFDWSPLPALRTVGSMPLDVGPFGHFDLYGSVFQMTRTHMNKDHPSAEFCALPDGATDFVTMGPPDSSVRTAVQFATRFQYAVGARRYVNTYVVFDSWMSLYKIGFRCAFDHRPQ